MMCAFWIVGMREVGTAPTCPDPESMQSSTAASNSAPSSSSEFTSIAALDISDDDLPF